MSTVIEKNFKNLKSKTFSGWMAKHNQTVNNGLKDVPSTATKSVVQTPSICQSGGLITVEPRVGNGIR